MNTQKGFSVIVLIIIAGILVFAGAFGVRYFTKKADETANWKTYKNDELGIEFKYPGDWKVSYEAVNAILGPDGVELSVSIAKDPFTFMAFQIIRVPNLYISASGEHLCPPEPSGLETGLGCPTFETKKQLVINGKPAKLVDAIGEGGPFRSVEILQGDRFYKIGQFLIPGKESELIIEKIAKTLIIFKPVVQKEPNNLFELDKIKVGDVVAGMKVVSIAPVFKNKPLSSQGLVNMSIKFSGEAQISGAYQYLGGPDDPITCNYFKLDEASRNNLPGLKDTPLNSLCVFAQDPKLDFKRGGQATIIIDDLILNYIAAGIPSGARIVKVVEDRPK